MPKSDEGRETEVEAGEYASRSMAAWRRLAPSKDVTDDAVESEEFTVLAEVALRGP